MSFLTYQKVSERNKVSNNSPSGTILSLDVGDRRIGVAVASLVARIAAPLTTIERSAESVHIVAALVEEHGAVAVVAGLPRGMDGQETAQTAISRTFAAELQSGLTIPVYLQDEALTSRQAEAELRIRGGRYDKAAVDALAAVYILEDYLLAQGV